MGSFSVTCSVSGLGISAGTPVRCLLLTESPYGDEDPRMTWIVRTPPLRAAYDDYGSIEDVHPDDEFIAALWLRGLREDVVERGLGDNSCHDVPVAVDMSFGDMLAAIQERRLCVSQDAQNFWARPRGIPGIDEAGAPALMRRVEQMLETRFPGRVSRGANEDKYVVDEPVRGMARVRFGQYQHGKKHTSALEAAREVVVGRDAEDPTGLTGVVTAGSGRYPSDADLLVFPLPAQTSDHVVGPQWDMAAERPGGEDRILRVGLAMIREDVWQALVAYPRCDYVSLPCVACGQSPSYHGEDRRCPDKSINGDPYKKHARKATYAHGPVLPAGVPHVVEPREWSEYVWYGVDAYRVGTRSTWAAVLAGLSRRRAEATTTATTRAPDPAATAPPGDAELDQYIESARKAREKEDARIRALPIEEQDAIRTAQKTQQEEWEAEDRRRRDRPFFGDFRIGDADVRDLRMPGAWVFRDSVPGVIGVTDHFSMLVADEVEAPEVLLNAVAELSAVRHAMSSVGVVLRPAASSGPQYPEWDQSARFARSVLQIAEAAGRDLESEATAPATLDEALRALDLQGALDVLAGNARAVTAKTAKKKTKKRSRTAAVATRTRRVERQAKRRTAR